MIQQPQETAEIAHTVMRDRKQSIDGQSYLYSDAMTLCYKHGSCNIQGVSKTNVKVYINIFHKTFSFPSFCDFDILNSYVFNAK